MKCIVDFMYCAIIEVVHSLQSHHGVKNQPKNRIHKYTFQISNRFVCYDRTCLFFFLFLNIIQKDKQEEHKLKTFTTINQV